MSKGVIGAIKLPTVPAELITELERTFLAPNVTPGYDRDKVLWDAACKSVVDWIKAKAHTPTVNREVRDPVADQRATVRYGS